MSTQVNNYARGKTAPASELTNLLGVEKWFNDDYVTTIPQTRRSGLKAKCRWVKNDSGGTLTARQAVKYKAAFWGLYVGDQADVGDKADGIVDEFVGTVANGEHFWLVVEGVTECISDGNGALAQGDVVCTVGTGTGKVRLQVAAPADTTAAMVQVNSRLGTVLETIAAVDGTTGRIYLDAHTH